MEKRLKNILLNLLKYGEKYLDTDKSTECTLCYLVPSRVEIVKTYKTDSTPVFSVAVGNNRFYKRIETLTNAELYVCEALFDNIVDNIINTTISTIETELNNNPPEDSLDETF